MGEDAPAPSGNLRQLAIEHGLVGACGASGDQAVTGGVQPTLVTPRRIVQ
jgi:hypothetical protein